MVSQSKSNNKSSMLILAAVFVLPVLLAKLALDNDWFNKAATNKGQLLDPPLDFSPIAQQAEPKWRLTYLLPAQCEVYCENALYAISQVRQALGKEAHRLKATLLATQQSDPAKLANIQEHSHLELLTADQQSVNKVFKDVPADGIFLVDTLNNVILHYPVSTEQQQTILQSREILADIRKLLKLSRIG